MIFKVSDAFSITVGCSVVIYLNLVLSLVEDSNVLTRETIIPRTINKLFSILKLSELDQKSRFKEYTALQEYFISLSLQDENSIEEIVRLSKMKEKSNNNSEFIATINDVFKEYSNFTDNKVVDYDDDYIIKYIDTFLTNLQDLKEEFNIHEDYVDINRDIVDLLYKDNKKLLNDLNENEFNVTESDESDIDENEFWEQSGRRIFKGKRSKIKYFPFMASVQIFNNFHCAGSIIKSDLIITASSCLQLAWNNRFFRENPAFLTARVGSSFYNSGGEVISILEIYFHPEYDPKSLKNNICLLRLSRHLKFKRRIRKVKKIDFDRNDHKLASNTPGITVVGWGAKSHSPVVGSPWENIISYAVLDVYPLEDCQDIYLKEYVSNKNFCAGFISRGGGACNRDVGGPGISDGKLLGVISFGSPVCGMPDAPTVFTKLGYYADWIEQIMEQDVPTSKKRTTLKPIQDRYGLYVSNTSPKPTTFKIAPITGKTMTPIPISQIDSQLRIIDGNVFKDFLETMFNSKEVEEYKDILKEIAKNPEKIYDKPKIHDVTETNGIATFDEFDETSGTEAYTKIEEFSSEQTTTKNIAYTIMDENVPVTEIHDNEIAKLMANVDLDKIVEEEIAKPDKVSSEQKPTNESILTLLYISDEDKNENEKLSSIEKNNKEVLDNEGMSIAVDNYNFEDLTKTKDSDNVLPETELYGLLSEVIGEEVRNINIDNL